MTAPVAVRPMQHFDPQDSQPDLGIWVVTAMAANLVMSFSEDVFLGGWLATFALMKMLLMRREESLNRPSCREGPIPKWA